MASKFPLNPYFREFVYDILYNIPEEKKFILKGKYYRVGKTNSYTKRFCDTAGIEEIMHVLSILGIEWTMIFFDDSSKERFIRNVFEKFNDDEKGAELRKIIKQRIYITSQKQFINNLATAAQTVHTNVYVKNLELLKAGYHYRNWPKKLDSLKVKEGFYNSDSLLYLSDTILNSYISCKQPHMNENDLLILLYLYRHQHKYIGFHKLGEKFAGILSRYKIINAANSLKEGGKIQKHPKDKTFTITATGINDVIRIMNNVLQANIF